MNQEHNQYFINELVARYEAMVEEGAMIFLEEKAYHDLIDYYDQEAQIERALEVADQALTHFSFTADFYTKKAQLFLRDDAPEKALEILDQASAYAPGEPDILLLRAEVFIHMGNLDEALSILDMLKPEAEGEVLSDILLTESLVYEKQEMYELMFLALKAALRENPSNVEALEQIWTAIECGKKYEEAIVLYEEVLDIDPYASRAWFYLGHAKVYFGQYIEAIECYEYAYLSNERFEAAYRECAETCYELKLYHKALQVYEEILEHFESDNDLLLRIGQCHQAMGKYSLARTFYIQALNYDPLDDEVLFHIGLCHSSECEWPKAIRYFRKAIQIEDTREEYYAALAEAYFQCGKYEKAETNFDKAVEAAPEQSTYWVRYACFLLQTGRGEEALELVEEADEFAAGPDLIYCRIGCLFFLGRRQEGLYWLGEALAEEYDQHRLLFDLMPDLEQDTDIISLITAYTSF